jgi:tetratricopeptide (TPR) repeat protein
LETKVWEDEIEIPTYCLGDEDHFPPFEREGDTSIYPYTMLDDLTDYKITCSYHAVFLENEYLLLTILPELGGRIYSAYDKISGREVFYRNNVIKPALIALRGAWISGGVEFNFPKGHSTTTVSPILYKINHYPDGSASVIVGNRERLSGMKWLVEIKLYPDRAYIETNIALYNPTSFPHRFYFWSNAAVPAHENMQFFYPITSAYYGSTTVKYPINEGVDLSWYINHKFAVDLFAKDCRDDFFCSYDHSVDFGVVHFANRYDAIGKKFFTWGSADDGLIWADILSDGDGPYCEIQSGRFKDQSTYDFLLPHFRESWREIWYSIRGIKGLKKANEFLAVNLKREGDKILLGICPTSEIPSAKIILEAKGERIFEADVSLSPKSPFLRELPGVKVDSPLTLKVIADGKELIVCEEELEESNVPEEGRSEGETSEVLYLQGLDRERFNWKKEAEKLYLRSLELDEGFSLAHIALGRLYLERGLWDKSEQHLKRALARNPHSGPANFYLGLLYKIKGEKEIAKEFLWKVRDGEFLPLSYYHLGEIALSEGDYLQAEELLRRALEKRADDVRAMVMLAVALRKKGDKESALEMIRKALKLDPLDGLVLFELYLLDGSEEFRDRLRRWDGLPVLLPNGEIGITQDSHLSEADDYLEIARSYINIGFWEEGIKAIEEYLRGREQVYPLTYYYLGFLWDRMGDEEKASESFKKGGSMAPHFVFPNEIESLFVLETALRYNPSDGFALYAVGNLLYALGREEEALRIWEEASRYLSFSPLYRNLAFGYWRVKGDFNKAEEFYLKAIELDKNWRLYLELDRLYASRKETRKRLELFLSAPERVREKSQVVARLAEIYLELGDYDKTIELLMSNTFRPWEGEVRMRQIYYRAFVERGKKLFGEGRYEEAMESFERALEYPRNIGVGKPYNAKDEEAREWLERTKEIIRRKGEGLP